MIARYYPAGQTYDGPLIEQLSLQQGSEVALAAGVTMEPCGGRVASLGYVKGTGSSLVLSEYRIG